MWIRRNKLWIFAFMPQPCLFCSKEFINEFWGRSWTLISHGFLIWHYQKINVLPNYLSPLHPIFPMLHLWLGQLCLCKGGWCDNKLSCTHIWKLWDHECQVGLLGVGQSWGLWCGGAKSIKHIPPFCVTITIHTFNLRWWG